MKCPSLILVSSSKSVVVVVVVMVTREIFSPFVLAPLFNHFLPNSRVVERFNILTHAITILLLFIVGCKYFSRNHFDDIKTSE